MTVTPDVIDLGTQRVQRAKARAAKREGRGDKLTIQDGDLMIAVLGPEFPLDVLEPLTDVNLDIALVIEQAVEMITASSQQQQAASMDLIAKILGANPHLFKELIAAIKEMGRRLFGDDGYANFVSIRPTPWDVADLMRGMFSWYGVGLGESSPPSEPSNGGATSKPTSNPTSNSMPVESGPIPQMPGSLGSDDSPI